MSKPMPQPPPPPRPRRHRTNTTPLTAEEQQLALHLYRERYGTRSIAKRLGRDRKTVRQFLLQAGCDPRARSHGPSPSRGSKLDPYQDAVRERVAKGLTTTRILREIAEMGYAGGRSILSRFVRSVRPAAPARKVKRRFETSPGQEMQFDWSVYSVPIAGQLVRVHALACVLAFSRYVHVRFYRNERMATLLEGLARAFEALGVALRLVLDNMATAVLGRVGPGRRSVLWHPRFLDLCRHYGTNPFACKVRDPDRKGKSEKVFLYLERDFIQGATFDSFEELNRRAQQWCDEVANQRVHRTTGRVPAEAYREERDFLVGLPAKRFTVHEDAAREVGPASTLSIAGTTYTVPSRLANHTVAVRLYAEHFEVLDPQGAVAFSRAYAEGHHKGVLQIDPAHYAPPRSASAGDGQRLEELFLRRYPQLEPFVEGLIRRMKTLAPVHLALLLRLAALYGEEPFLRAAGRAQQFRRFTAGAVRRLLVREQPEVAEDTVTPLASDPHARVLAEDIDAGSLSSYDDIEKAEPVPGSPDPEDGDEPK